MKYAPKYNLELGSAHGELRGGSSGEGWPGRGVAQVERLLDTSIDAAWGQRRHDVVGLSRGGRPKAAVVRLVRLGLTQLALDGVFSTQIGLLPGMKKVCRPKKVSGSSSSTTKKREGKKS